MQPTNIQQLDARDCLAGKKAAFRMPSDLIYLNGNSLGPLPASVPARLQSLIEQEWGADLISSWNTHDWIGLPQQVGEKIAPLLGAAAGQVISCDSVSVNLFKLLSAALQLRADRSVVLSQSDNFPTDLYIAQGLESLLTTDKAQLRTVPGTELVSALNEQVAVLYLTQVNFRTAAKHDIAALTRAAHEKGALVIWDLSHSVGAVPLALDEWQVDFAVGCGYKFLNGGPGAPSFIYANETHHGQFQQVLQGWMGHDAPFTFEPGYRPAKGMTQFLTGTPNILSLAALDTALDVFADVEVAALDRKAAALGDLFIALSEAAPGLSELTLESPRNSAERGAQLSYSHPQAWSISRALHREKLMMDFREPDLLRFGFSPLAVSFEDVWRAAGILQKVMENRLYEEAECQDRLTVT